MLTIVWFPLSWVLVALLGAQATPATDLPVASYPSAAAAVQAILADKTQVVAFGEYHQQKTTAKIPSALKRFTREILPVLAAAGTTDLVAESWLTTGECGEVERKAVAQVHKTTERPATTENEVVTLLRQAKAAGLQPRILQVACKDYQAIFAGDQVDFDRLLRLTRDQLEIQIRKAMQRPGSRAVVSYGGALHNDLRPSADLAPYSFGPAITQAVDGHYLEIDLYVPEYIEKDASIQSQDWYKQYRKAYRPRRVFVIERGPRSYALVFARNR